MILKKYERFGHTFQVWVSYVYFMSNVFSYLIQIFNKKGKILYYMLLLYAPYFFHRHNLKMEKALFNVKSVI